MRKRIYNALCNQRGALILEQVLATMFLMLMSVFVISSIYGAYNLFFESYQDYKTIQTSYGELEQRNKDVELPGFETTQTGTIQYYYNGAAVTIDGTYFYDNTNKRMGEFVIDED